ncbi:unnamed protein product [Protopolystoma xenopodis]|uniref:Ig-like domain-containing protein n=1 Tax=Protopolystoma xenopodis TaxID=117903 RepID=A0A448XJQ2_9PLAT|nr:unnamed protein product [Protopolystoma xenopodis]
MEASPSPILLDEEATVNDGEDNRDKVMVSEGDRVGLRCEARAPNSLGRPVVTWSKKNGKDESLLARVGFRGYQ